MTTDEIKAKYPRAIEMIDSVESTEQVYYIRGNKTVHNSTDGKYYYNSEGLHIREFNSLEHVVKWFYGTPEEEAQAEEELKEFVYSSHLSKLQNDSEVWLDEDGNVAEDYCDFTNEDFDGADLELAKKEL